MDRKKSDISLTYIYFTCNASYIQYYLRHILLTHYIVLIFTFWSSNTLIFLNLYQIYSIYITLSNHYQITFNHYRNTSNIYQITIENLSDHFYHYQTSVKHILSDHYQTYIELLIVIEDLLNAYQTSIEHLSNYYWTSIRTSINRTAIKPLFIDQFLTMGKLNETF